MPKPPVIKPPVIPGSPEAAADANAFSKAKAFNTPGFAQFLDGFADKSKGIDDETLETRFNAFSKVGETTKKLKEFYQGELKQELGIDFTAKDLEDVDKHLKKEAVDNPESLAEIGEQLEKFKASTLLVKALETQVEELAEKGGYSEKIEGEEEFQQAALQALQQSGFLSLVNMYTVGVWDTLRGNDTSARQALENRKYVTAVAGGSSDKMISDAMDASRASAAQYIEELKKGQDVIKGNIDKVKADMAALKTGLFGLNDLQAKLVDKIGSKIDDHAKNMLNKAKNMGEVNASFDFARKVKGLEGDNSMGLDLSQRLAALQPNGLEQHIETEAKYMVSDRMWAGFEKVKLGSNDWDKMKKVFDEVISTKKIAGLEGDDAKDYIVSELTALIDELENGKPAAGGSAAVPPTADTKAKALILQQLLNDATA